MRPCKAGKKNSIRSKGNGSLIVDKVGDLPGVGEVYYYPKFIANVLSFSKIAKLYRITFDNSKWQQEKRLISA